MGKDKKKRQPLGMGRIIILIICAIVFVGCAGYLGLYLYNHMSAQSDFSKLADAKTVGLQEIYNMNSDTVAWVKIEGTKVDYPVMRTPEKPEYYLYKNFEKEDSVPGTPFVDGLSGMYIEGIYDDELNSSNWLVHGHNIKVGTMFHDLLKYEDEEFWKEHPTFYFDVITSVKDGRITVDGTQCEIIAACKSRIRQKGEEGFRYYQCGGIYDEESFNEYIEGVKGEALYETGVDAEYGDQLVTLSTCAYHTDNGRFYIVGVKKANR